MVKPTMKDIEELELHDKIVHRCMVGYRVGHFTKEEALMKMVILLASHNYTINMEFVDTMLKME